MRAAFAPAALLSVLAASAACGGDDRLSREEYLTRADAICAKYEKRLDALPEPSDADELAALAERALPVAEEGVGELRKLKPPEALAAQVDDWLERNDTNLDKIEELRDAARAGDEREIRAVATETAENEQKADALAREIGLDDCARD